MPNDRLTDQERRYAALQTELADYYDISIESRWLETDIGRIHYLVTGAPEGEPVLLLHGLTGQAAYWLQLAPSLADQYRLYIPDMPGEGLSSKLSYHDRNLRSFLVTHLLGLLNELNLDHPHVVGHSIGGWQAFLLAIDHDAVDRLCLVGAPAGLTRSLPFLARLLTINGLNRVLFWLLNQGDAIENAKEWMRRFGVVDDAEIPQVYYELFAARNDLPGLQASLQSLMSELGSFGRAIPLGDISDEITEIDRVTRFIWGTNDYFWNPDVGRRTANRMQNATFTELPMHGHVPWMEPTDTAAKQIRSFLDKKTGGKS